MPNNDEQIAFWNGEAGATWVLRQQAMDAMLSPISASLLEQANGQAGEQALDVGCGCGDTSLSLANKGLKVTGVDISEPMLAHANGRKSSNHHLSFIQADAATHRFSESFDLILSRFGVMFFDDPLSAFTNLYQALQPQGRLCFVCWQAPALNNWISLPMQAVKPFLPPSDPPDPLAPGPFAFADRDRLHSILSDAGFNNIHIDAQQHPMLIGTDVDNAIEFTQNIGPMGALLRELPDDQVNKARAALREALLPFESDTGVALEAATWLVRANRSA